MEELTFTDDGMFQAVMRDPALCTELIEGLNFGDKITKMIYNASGYEKETDAWDFNAPLPKVLERLKM